jgi:hypothetical protein
MLHLEMDSLVHPQRVGFSTRRTCSGASTDGKLRTWEIAAGKRLT